jgi:hypothetical protein
LIVLVLFQRPLALLCIAVIGFVTAALRPLLFDTTGPGTIPAPSQSPG